MKRSLVFLPFILIFSSLVFGQSSRSVKFFEKGEKAVAERNFGEAKAYLEKSIAEDSTNGNSYYLLAYLNILDKDYEKARQLYRELMKCCSKDAKFMLAHLSLAEYEWSLGNYKKAIGFANSFLAFNPGRKKYREIRRANKILASSNYALENIDNVLPYSYESIGEKVNVKAQQYFPAITADGKELYFTARDERDNENIFKTSYFNAEWSSPEEVEELNTQFNEGTCSISADGTIMIFTSCESTRDRAGYGSCDLFITQKVGDKWSKPKNLGPNINSRDWESQPSLSADGRTLYFVSDRRGGQGKKDIWVSYLNEHNQWTLAENLGETINTADDDLSPYIHSNGHTLYFSSEGHLGFGGLDLFKSEKASGSWSTPQNLGYPINDHSDQVSLVVSADGSKGYFSKEHIDGNQRTSKIVSFDLPKEIIPQSLSTYLKGVVYDAITKKPIKAQLELKLLDRIETESKVLSDGETGKYLIVLNQNEEYALYISKPGYLFQSLTFDMHNAGVEGVTLDVFLQRVDQGTNITLSNIFFNSNEYVLQKKSNVELNKVKDFLVLNPSLNVEISGHTDNIGSQEYNLDLSQKRAEAVTNYLIKNGIDASRLKAVGYGEKKPIADNNTELGRKENRRIEFEIL
ncbi:OmpA family protein [Flammeovirga aprica]|uniref:OmpA family protein n=1 Tax=Flammeovirga aprica JL-4 TaxID=694437 RepID=A0A7X9XCZ3_9BACT|nr:OmpA family protein [Flammeovirga aprica]NME72253.1 OmpA family protein [Flammeovirga aprica JL-4]